MQFILEDIPSTFATLKRGGFFFLVSTYRLFTWPMKAHLGPLISRKTCTKGCRTSFIETDGRLWCGWNVVSPCM